MTAAVCMDPTSPRIRESRYNARQVFASLSAGGTRSVFALPLVVFYPLVSYVQASFCGDERRCQWCVAAKQKRQPLLSRDNLVSSLPEERHVIVGISSLPLPRPSLSPSFCRVDLFVTAAVCLPSTTECLNKTRSVLARRAVVGTTLHYTACLFRVPPARPLPSGTDTPSPTAGCERERSCRSRQPYDSTAVGLKWVSLSGLESGGKRKASARPGHSPYRRHVKVVWHLA